MTEFAAEAGKIFTGLFMELNRRNLELGERQTSAVLVKGVALMVIAFGMPATTDEETPDYSEALAKLKWAMKELGEIPADKPVTFGR